MMAQVLFFVFFEKDLTLMMLRFLKSCKKMISADIKTDVKKQKIKELVVVSYYFSQKYLFKS